MKPLQDFQKMNRAQRAETLVCVGELNHNELRKAIFGDRPFRRVSDRRLDEIIDDLSTEQRDVLEIQFGKEEVPVADNLAVDRKIFHMPLSELQANSQDALRFIYEQSQAI